MVVEIMSPLKGNAITLDASDFQRIAKKYDSAARKLRGKLGYMVSQVALWAKDELAESAPSYTENWDRPFNHLRNHPPLWKQELRDSFGTQLTGSYTRVVTCDEMLKLSFVVFGVKAPAEDGYIHPRHPRKWVAWPPHYKRYPKAFRPMLTERNDFVSPIINEVQARLQEGAGWIVAMTVGEFSDYMNVSVAPGFDIPQGYETI